MTADMPDTDAHILLGILDKHGLTQQELADLLGVSQSTISEISNGQWLFTRRHITALCQQLPVNPRCFFPNCIDRFDNSEERPAN